MTEKSKEETLLRKKQRLAKRGIENNPVAKHMNSFNRPKRHADLTKDHDEKDRYKVWRKGVDPDED